jgi:hypothetical protein
LGLQDDYDLEEEKSLKRKELDQIGKLDLNAA